MAEKIINRAQAAGKRPGGQDMRILLEAAQSDIANLRTAIVAITAKLDADAGVTDTNYGALCNPAALNFTK